MSDANTGTVEAEVQAVEMWSYALAGGGRKCCEGSGAAVLEHASGEEDDSADQIEHAAYGDAYYAEGQDDEPDYGVGDQG
jgi:hypothetical protein